VGDPQQHGIEPAPQRNHQTWAGFLRSQAHAILACDYFTATTVTSATYHVFAVIEHAGRRVRVLGVTTHPTAEWTTQIARNLIMDPHDAGTAVKYPIRDHDSKYTRAFDAVFETESLQIIPTGIHIPTHELDHRAVGTDLPTRASRPDPDLEPSPPASRTR
jgi:putative transposase